jgi:hypothetical protein
MNSKQRRTLFRNFVAVCEKPRNRKMVKAYRKLANKVGFKNLTHGAVLM